MGVPGSRIGAGTELHLPCLVLLRHIQMFSAADANAKTSGADAILARADGNISCADAIIPWVEGGVAWAKAIVFLAEATVWWSLVPPDILRQLLTVDQALAAS